MTLLRTPELLPPARGEAPTRAPSWFDRQCRAATLARLAELRHGQLRVIENNGMQVFGRGGPGDLQAAATVHDPRFWGELALGGALGAGEAYIHGWWTADDLTALLRIFAQNDAAADRLSAGMARLAEAPRRAAHWLRANTRAGARRNIAAHYDLGNDFFARMLDDTMMYSCGVFPRPDASLREASVEKLERICRKLDLRPGDRVVEIGTGWGGFALHAAGNYGCRVTTATISARQAEFAEARIADAGLADRATVVRQDYRDLRGTYDKLASIEMVEAIGHRHYRGYYQTLSRLLAPGGLACLQAITIADRYYQQAKRGVDYIKKHVFPGSCIPSHGALAAAAAATDLRLLHAEDFGPHYARTLAAWGRNVAERRGEILALGYSPAFLRLWDYYLCYCAAGFLERTIGVAQLIYEKPAGRRPPLLGRFE